jgi:CheY-like chemotaxis protein
MEPKPLLLIAEDDPDDQLLFRDAIDVACAPVFETHFVWSGAELLRFLKTHAEYQPGLVVLDLNMPGKDGRTVLREIKADPSLANIPIAILTTSHSKADLQYCHDHGVIAYYHKPSSMAELKEIFRNLCTDYLQ